MRGPLSRLSERLGRRRPRAGAAPARVPLPPLPSDMGRGAPEMQLRLEAARSRLKAQSPPLPDED